MDTSLYETGQPTLRAERVPNQVAYRQVRENVSALLTETPVDDAAVVPACPTWTVRDLVAHLVGISALSIGRLSGAAPAAAPPSTEMGVPELLAQWTRLGTQAEELLSERGGRSGSIMVMDAFTHELDLRYALGVGPPAEHAAFAVAFEVLANGFSASVIHHDLPGLRLSTGETSWSVGDSEPIATVTADRYDLYRSLAGRRTPEQITALGWDRDSHRWLPAFNWGPFYPPETPVERSG
jgi:uncharacterized protein (TIGR03083 family)